MRILLTLILSLLLVGCAQSSMPKFPEIKYHYMVEVRDESSANIEILSAIVNAEDITPLATVARCLKFEIVNKTPYKIKFISEVTLSQCNLIGGYKPADSKSLLNWIDEVTAWAMDRKKCFK